MLNLICSLSQYDSESAKKQRNNLIGCYGTKSLRSFEAYPVRCAVVARIAHRLLLSPLASPTDRFSHCSLLSPLASLTAVDMYVITKLT